MYEYTNRVWMLLCVPGRDGKALRWSRNCSEHPHRHICKATQAQKFPCEGPLRAMPQRGYESATKPEAARFLYCCIVRCSPCHYRDALKCTLILRSCPLKGCLTLRSISTAVSTTTRTYLHGSVGCSRTHCCVQQQSVREVSAVVTRHFRVPHFPATAAD